jgi:hydroxymethylbilane synthase
VGQGAIAIEARQDDRSTNSLISPLNHEPTRLACQAERAFLKGLGGGCLVPIAALAKLEGRNLTMSGLVARPDGSEIVRANGSGPREEAASIGLRLAKELLELGADRLLADR